MTTQPMTTTPPTGAWTIDPRAAHVSFTGRVSRLAPAMRARFTEVSGTLRIAESLGDSEVLVHVDTTSMTTGNRTWDELLAAVDPFDVAAHPIASYAGRVVRCRDGVASVEGALTLRGVSRPLTLTVTGDGPRFRATGWVDRTDFGVRCDLPGVGRLIPRRLRLDIDVTTTRAAVEKTTTAP